MSDGVKHTTLATFKSGKRIDDTTYADFAQEKMEELSRDVVRGQKFGGLTTSKLRGIYGLVMNVYTKINEPSDFARHVSDLQYLKVKMAYEAGREDSVKNFLNKTYLRDLISYVKTYEQFLLYCRYAESLVAYFKFYGGKDK